MTPRRYLAACLVAMTALFVAWSLKYPHTLTAGLLVFALPPVLIYHAVLRGWRRAGFIASMFALLWFSHGVMVAWAEPALRLFALGETALALLVIHAACLPGMRERRERRQAAE